ncbi:MAG: CPBP family intramembrane metalloprotease [bacterium]|nr:CPBP family intramembrane metalloprotease [bacterium]
MKLNKRDYTLIGVCIAIALVFGIVTAKYFHKAFPEASIDLKITNNDAHKIANDFLSKQGVKIDDFTQSTIFDYDNDSKTFLERELGLEQANKVMGSKVRLWRWKTRYFKPLQKEEFTLDVTSTGEIVGFEHLIKEEDSAKELTEQDARKIAETYIKEQLGLDTAKLNFLTSESEKRPNRLDWTFTWKTFEIKDAEYRIEVTVQGEEIGSYREFLKIPEKWTRDYTKLRSLNNTASAVDSVLFVLIGIAMFFGFITNIRNKNIKWTFAVSFGTIAAVLSFLSSINGMPLSLFSYDTTSSYGAFIGRNLLFALLGAFAIAAFISFLTASSETVYRETYKSKISFSNLFKWQNIQSKQFFISIIVGLTMAFFFIGYQVIFYVFAQKFGAWSPAEIPYSDMLNTKAPWLFSLIGGFEPAVFEEFMFRVFAIVLCKKIFKSNWLAIIIPAFIWGFAHSAYPQQPFYIRGLEVGLAGILVGILLIKFDILAVLVWHYTIDAFYTAFLLLRSHNSYFIVSGLLSAGVMLIPLIVCIVCYIKNKGFKTTDNLTNEKEGVSKVESIGKVKTEEISFNYSSSGGKSFKIGIIIAIVFLCSLLIKTEKFGSFVSYKISKKESRVKADEFLKSKGVDPGKYKTVTFAESDIDNSAAKYILERQGIKGLNNIYGKTIKPAVFCTRYFNILKEEEYNVYVSIEGQVYSFEHTIAEADSGAEISKDSALIMGTSFLKGQGINLDDYELKETSPEKRKARLDYNIIWEAKKGLDKAKLRQKVTIQGNEVADYEQFMKIPEDWQREREKNTGFDIARKSIAVLLCILLLGLALWSLRSEIKQIQWKIPFTVGAIFAGIQILNKVNNLPLIYQNYITSIGLNIFNITIIIGIFMTILGIFFFSALCTGVIMALYPNIFEGFRAKNLSLFGKDAIVFSIIGLCLTLGIANIENFLTYRFPQFSNVPELKLPGHMDTNLPFLSTISSNFILVLFILTALAVGIHLLKYYNKKPVYLVLIIILGLFSFTDGKTIGENAFSLLSLLLSIGSMIILVKWILRDNLLAYPLYFWVSIFGHSAYLFYTKSLYKIDSVILFVVAILPLIWVYIGSRRQIKKSQIVT